MTRIIIRSALLLLLAGSCFQCRRSNTNPSQNILTGKLVIDGGCNDDGAIEVLSGQIDPSQLMASWTDPDNDSTYHNVFKCTGVRNMCSLSGYDIVQGDTFRFQLDPNPQNLTCNTCAIYSNPAMPTVSNAVMNVKKIDTVLTGKLVAIGGCGQIVIGVLSGNIDPAKVLASWKDPSTGNVYSNVFCVGNVCSFGAAGLSPGDVFTFGLDPAPPAQTCAICNAILANFPTVFNAIKGMQRQN